MVIDSCAFLCLVIESCAFLSVCLVGYRFMCFFVFNYRFMCFFCLVNDTRAVIFLVVLWLPNGSLKVRNLLGNVSVIVDYFATTAGMNT